MRTTRVLRETLIRLDEVSKTIPGAPTRHAIQLWTKQGILVRAGTHEGKRATLEYANVGGAQYTSREAYDRFLEAINGEDNELTEDLFGACP